MTARAWSGADQREFIGLRDLLLAELSAAQKERDKRSELVPVEGDWPEAGWIRFERDTMLSSVNRERASRGKALVTAGDILKVERIACGHSDYSSKFALYCAEIIMGTSPNVRP